MDWLVGHIEILYASTGLLSAVWAGGKWADKSFKKHLSEEFATKADLDVGLTRLEDKLSKILITLQLREFNKEDKLKLL